MRQASDNTQEVFLFDNTTQDDCEDEVKVVRSVLCFIQSSMR